MNREQALALLDMTKHSYDPMSQWSAHAVDAILAAYQRGREDADWRSATGYATPAEYRADRDKGLNAALAEPKQEPCWCDENNIGVPGETCGDCPRDYASPIPIPEPALVAAARAVLEDWDDLDSKEWISTWKMEALRKALP